MTKTYTVITAYGAFIQGQPQFAFRAQAIRWAQEQAHVFPGCAVREVVQPPPIVRTVWRDRSELREVA